MGTRNTWWPGRTPLRAAGSFLCGLLLFAAWVLPAAPARASTGYEPDAVKPQIGLSLQYPHGIAIDQASQRIYVAIVAAEFSLSSLGAIIQLNSDGTQVAGSPFGSGTETYFFGVAVNPLTQDLFAARGILSAPGIAHQGEPRMHRFSSASSPLGSFALNNPEARAPQIAIDSAGRIYYPNAATDSIEVFNSAGSLQSTISCGDCPAGSFATPSGVAVDSADNVYVVDLDKDFVVKLKPASQSYAFERLFQSGRGAGAVAVDPVSGDVFVGDLPNGTGYHVVAYDSSGNQFDDFAAGMVSDPPAGSGRTLTPQLAVNATTRKLYIADQGKLLVFERTDIAAPTATVNAASSVGQQKGTLNATVNANGHAVLECEFEYTDHADFLVNAFANAESAPCSGKPSTTTATPVSAAIGSLSPSTTYHYRVMATSNAGSTPSGGQTFTTLASVPPTVTAQPAIGVTQTSATLVGRVNPKGGTISDCHFEWGASTSYGTNLPCANLPGHVTTDVTQTRALLGLTPGTTYHYRLVVTSNAGTAKGGDAQFTTTSPPTTLPPTTPSETPPTGTPPLGAIAPPLSPVVPKAPAKPLRCKKGFQKKKVRGKLRCVKKKKRARRKSRSAAR